MRAAIVRPFRTFERGRSVRSSCVDENVRACCCHLGWKPCCSLLRSRSPAEACCALAKIILCLRSPLLLRLHHPVYRGWGAPFFPPHGSSLFFFVIFQRVPFVIARYVCMLWKAYILQRFPSCSKRRKMKEHERASVLFPKIQSWKIVPHLRM